MKLSKILKIGLTGGIGSGKSVVSNIFKENDIPVIDADKISREVLKFHIEILDKIRHRFGEEYFDVDGSFLRRKMGELIFTNEKKKAEYEEILMPYIIEDIFNKIKEYDDIGMEICIVDAPTLIENNLHNYMDKVIVVSVINEIQIERVMKRDNFSRKEVLNRINNQMTTEEKCKFADFIIDNNGKLYETKIKVNKILSDIRNE